MQRTYRGRETRFISFVSRRFDLKNIFATVRVIHYFNSSNALL